MERVEDSAELLGKISVLFHSNLADKGRFKKFSDLACDLAELREFVASIRESNSAEETFIFHSGLDSMFVNLWHLPRLFLNIRKFLPWSFTGVLISPDRRTLRRLFFGKDGQATGHLS